MFRFAGFFACVVLLSVQIAFGQEDRAEEGATTKPAVMRPPTHADVKYGPHPRNVMDVWLAKSDRPTPVLISIHGGGFIAGKKSVNARLLEDCLRSGISVVAISYRYSTDAIAPAPLLDGARAVQFVRSNAAQWNIDGPRVACMGNSAGAAMSLWIAFHDDLANPASNDPVERESTRIACAIATNGQVSYDPRFIKDLFPEFDVTQHPAIASLVGVKPTELANLSAEKYKLFEDSAALTHLSKGDPPVLLRYLSSMDTPVTSIGIGIHHPRFGKVLKDKMDELGIPCELKTRGQAVTSYIDFLRSSFGIVPAAGR